jgi:hypothetical protein
MPEWITIVSFTYPLEANLAKGKLESEGIEVFINDELTAQVNNFYSNAIGGVKLIVKDSDYDIAYKILIESGYIIEKPAVPNKFLDRFDKVTSRLPWIGKSILELRLIVLAALLLIIIIIPFVILTLPSTLDKLQGKGWCVEKINYKGHELTPEFYGIRLEGDYYDCPERLTFRENGMVFFPGIRSYDVIAHWELRNDSLIITPWPQDDNITFVENPQKASRVNAKKKSVYIGAFYLEIKNNTLKMQSDSITIIGKK